jgi:hypothetical protein
MGVKEVEDSAVVALLLWCGSFISFIDTLSWQ